MLQSLHIVNFAIIEDTVIDFSDGATVFTGETGAGKSIIVDALAVLTGRRARTDLIRTGADFFQVEGVFGGDSEIKAILEEMGIEVPGMQIVISRKLNRSGRGICMINGHFCTVKQLELIGKTLVRLHEQNDTLELLSSAYCERMIDSAEPGLIGLYDRYKKLYLEWKQTQSFLDDFDKKRQENERRVDILDWEVAQITDAEIYPGEDEDIEKRLSVLQNYEKIIHSLQSALSDVVKDNGAQDQLAAAIKNISSASRYDERIGRVEESLKSALFALEDSIGNMESYVSESDFSEEELAELQSRSETLLNLKRKFGSTLEEVILYKEKAEKESSRLKNMVYENEEMKKKSHFLSLEIKRTAEDLNHQRISAGESITGKMEKLLHDMGIENARMQLHLVPSNAPTPTGADEMELYFSANIGEPLRSMKDTASGGELSRIALAVEILIAQTLKKQTLVFDEIDVGISGKVGLQIARKIKGLAKMVQVIVITHLPQTASIANNHYKIEKIVEQGHTSSKAVYLNPTEHIANIAQMISGTNGSESAMRSAWEMQKLLEDC